MAFDKKTWENGRFNPKARLNAAAMNDLEDRIESGIAGLLPDYSEASEGDVLTIGSGGPEWAEPQGAGEAIAAHVRTTWPNTDQNMLVGDTVVAEFKEVVFDPHGMLGGNPGSLDRLIAPVRGIYIVSGCWEFETNPNGVRQVGLTKSGTYLGWQRVNAASIANTDLSIAHVSIFDEGDYAQLIGLQDGVVGGLPVFGVHLSMALIARLS